MGTVYLVGAGPGDPGLITLNGIKRLQTCDVVVYDRLVSYQLLEYLQEDCIQIYVGKKAGQHSKKQEEINQILIESAKNYDKVVRLKGGDPFVFGRGGEEIEELQKNNIPFEVIPGVSSAISVPESVGIPVTHRGISQSFHVITGHTKSEDGTLTEHYEEFAKLDGTLVFLMGLTKLSKIVDGLLKNGKDKRTPVAVISNGTMYHEKTVRGTLETIIRNVKEEDITSPAIIVIGKTAALHFVQKDRRMRTNQKIGIIGTRTMREKLMQRLQKLSSNVYSICTMDVMETECMSQLEKELMRIHQYQWIFFTSQNAIKLFFEKMEEWGIDRRNLAHIQFAVIGSGTKQELQKYGYFADFIPSKYTIKDFTNEIIPKIHKNDSVLIPRAKQGSNELTERLKNNKIYYKDLPIYDVKGKLTENKAFLSEMEYLIFVSASGVRAFFEEIEAEDIQLPTKLKIACIGEVTAEELKKYDRRADIVANINNTDGLLKELEQGILQNVTNEVISKE